MNEFKSNRDRKRLAFLTGVILSDLVGWSFWLQSLLRWERDFSLLACDCKHEIDRTE